MAWTCALSRPPTDRPVFGGKAVHPPLQPGPRRRQPLSGGKKGLIVNSRNLCFKPKRNRARSNLRGQNGRKQLTKPRVVSIKCAKRRKARRRHNKRARAKRAANNSARATRATRASRAG